MIRTRPVGPEEVRAYMKKAREFLHAAATSLEAGHLDACALNAIHAAISALDAYCGHTLKNRSASTNHGDAVRLAKTAAIPGGPKRIDQVLEVLLLKTSVEYEARRISEEAAERALTKASRFTDFVEEVVRSPAP